eukprot:12427709-Karenia_brevis.AAC.1
MTSCDRTSQIKSGRSVLPARSRLTNMHPILSGFFERRQRMFLAKRLIDLGSLGYRLLLGIWCDGLRPCAELRS